MNKIIRLETANLSMCFRFWDFEFNIEKRKRIESDILSGNRSMFVYVYAGEYVAGVSLSVYDEGTYLISYLAVEERYQNKGCGTALIEFACAYAKARNQKRILLEVDFDNIRAKRLYQKLGFSAEEANPQNRIRMIKYLT
ncbi:MAG: GNAT family N-acetyltransferase [Oscillospiraceae bacterium]|nr:GNAT family N-acetyltransferase [Oscillospiraceae bacterium]